jgi:hypothetical protein
MISMINVPRCEWDYWTGLPADNCARIEAGRSESREGDRAGRCTTLRLVIRDCVRQHAEALLLLRRGL